MFDFLKKKNKSSEYSENQKKSDKKNNSTIFNAANATIANKMPKEKMAGSYNRRTYENKAALESFRRETFNGNSTVKDPYTDKILYQKQAQAREVYGSDFAQHAADIDHIAPLKNIYEEHKYNPFLSDDDIRKIANIKENYKAISAQMNRSKGELTNTQYAQRENLSPEMQQKLYLEEEKANQAIRKAAAEASAKNAIKMAGKSALIGSAIGGAISSVQNLKEYRNKKIDGKTAAKNIAKDAAKSGGTAAVMTVTVKAGEGIMAKNLAGTVLEKSCNSFIASGGVAKAAVCTVEAGKSVIRYIKGDIDGGQLADELTEKTVSLSSSFALGAQGAAIGSIVGTILCPGVGTAIGSFVGDLAGNLAGYTLGSSIFKQIKEYKNFVDNYNPEELARYREMYKNIEENLKYQREALEVKLNLAYEEKSNQILNTMLYMKDSLLSDDNEGFNNSIEQMCGIFGFELRFKTQKEFDNFMKSDEIEEW